MAEYYGDYGQRHEKGKRRSFIGWLVDVLIRLLTVITAIAVTLTYIAPYINPASSWVFSILGLAAPVTYLVTLLLALYWIVRWRWIMASLMLFLVFIGLFKVSLFYKPEFRKVYEQQLTQSERGTLKFMTYNVRMFYDDDGHSSLRGVMELIGRTDPDVVCLQEFNPALADGEPEYEAFLQNYEYVAGGVEHTQTSQMAIFSKYKILRWGSLSSGGRDDDSHNSVWADMIVVSDTVRVFSNHLHSTAINASDNEFITKHHYISDSAREDRIRSIIRRFRDNSILRAVEVDSISHYIREAPHARIVCGDFNDTPMSYVYRAMSRGLNDAFRECGRGYSYTYRGFFNTLRIDYVLSSEELEPVSYEVLDADYSDHRPIVVRLRYTS